MDFSRKGSLSPPLTVQKRNDFFFGCKFHAVYSSRKVSNKHETSTVGFPVIIKTPLTGLNEAVHPIWLIGPYGMKIKNLIMKLVIMQQ